MTNVVLLSLICRWLNGLGYKAIQAPSDNPAPAGRHIAVALTSTRQHGDMLVPGPLKNPEQKKYRSIMQVAQVQLYEVEGDGEWLRDIRNRMQGTELDDFIAGECPVGDDGLDNGFSVWDIGDIVDNSSQDGAFWIRQRTMTFDCQFMDHIEHKTPRIESVSGTLGTLEINDNFKVEVK